MTQPVLEFPVLIGDIGGTNARFSLFFGHEEQEFPTQTVKDFSNIDAVIAQDIMPLAKKRPRSLMLAIAGPVIGREIALTNSHWVIKPKDLMEKFGFEQVFMINDFEAQAMAITALHEEYLKLLGGHASQKDGSRVILGPGTGLGVAGLVYADERFIPVSSEGGHIDFAPVSERGFQIIPFIEKCGGRVSAEQILSGRGLLNIYYAICKADNVSPRFHTPDAITLAAHNKAEQQARETVDFFLYYLARLAGDLALVFEAHGGVYIAGGIILKIFSLIDDASFRAAFEDKAPHHELLKTIPLYLVTHPRAAIQGMMAFAEQPDRFIINTKNRLSHKLLA